MRFRPSVPEGEHRRHGRSEKGLQLLGHVVEVAEKLERGEAVVFS